MATVIDAVGVAASPDFTAPKARRVAAIAVLAFSWSACVVALALSLGFGLPLVGENLFVVSHLLSAIVYAPIAALLVWRQVGVVAVVLSVLAVGAAIAAVGNEYAFLAADYPGLPGLWFAQHVLDRAWLPGTLAAFSFLPLLLTSRRATRSTIVLAIVGSVASVLPVVLALVRQRPDAEPNPWAITAPGAQDTIVVLFYSSLGTAVAVAIVTGVILLYRWLTWDAAERRGLGWLILGQWMLIAFFSPILLAWFPDIAFFLSDYAPLSLPFAQLFMPAAILVLALGQRLWGLDAAINRAIVWTLLVAALMLAYISVALFANAVLPVAPTIAGVVGVAAFALAVEPIRRWIQRRVDSLVYGEAAEPAQLMRALGDRLGEGSSGAELQRLVDALLVTLRLGHLSVRSTRVGGVAAESGIPGPGAATELQLRNAHDTIGVVSATARGRQRVDRRTIRVLEDIAGVLSVALQLADVNEEARQARDRIVDVRDEERRMVRRELHDGLAPALEATVDDLDAIPSTLDEPSTARAAIDAVRLSIAARTNDVRDLARTLLPGSLDAGDLEAALTELGERFSSADIRVDVHANETCDLDSTRQAAVYHVAAEAVLLARRTPRVSRIGIDVEVTQRDAVVTLTHDGDARGSDTDVVVASIAGRAEDLGGVVRAQRDSDGLLLIVEVPA
ncbi:signal transduction histidine kinase [Microbacteriaceae bacterium SG_E_30_P1]|uniref:histidine kinase n=1 Tax=Antiquaquibacter oligotrophicus TaxID=2880260 RepID=A0ABT6KKL4_9MICO|nr:histidine kinase [Antiquaquibacter oligotrophicus]MDH6179978.1 signal transduction histidine kinase [Antiquaquibacter oligotrophicus]UDF14265.1 histidine kinase [Antiquaquibacter oligotrophicus]